MRALASRTDSQLHFSNRTFSTFENASTRQDSRLCMFAAGVAGDAAAVVPAQLIWASGKPSARVKRNKIEKQIMCVRSDRSCVR